MMAVDVTMMMLLDGLAITNDAILAGWKRIGNKDGHILINLQRRGIWRTNDD